jgi:DeoR/GlpR family transcriptional regulator of sugar metabolism
LIQPGETVFLGSGTTAAEVLRHLDPACRARIVTHNAGALAMAKALSIDLFLLGGSYRPHTNATGGAEPAELASHFYATKMLLGADGISLEEGVTTPSTGLAIVERVMIQQTKGEVVVLVDSSKIGIIAPVAICPLDQIDIVVVDDGIGEEVVGDLQRLGVKVVVT